MENLDKDLDWAANITWDIIEDNFDKPWEWYYVSQNPNYV